ALLQPGVLAAKHLLSDAIDRLIVAAVEPIEQRVYPQARLTAKQVGERDRLGVSLLREHMRADARRRDREQLGADVDGAEQHHLLALEPRPEAHHGVEERASELPRPTLGKAQVLGQRPELAVALRARQPARRIPRRIEWCR